MDQIPTSIARNQSLFRLVRPVVEGLELELVAVELTSDGGAGRGGGTLRVTIDREGGVELSHLTRVNQALSAFLDAEDPIPSAYLLEVSSPGIDRPLQKRSDFKRFVGFTVRVRLSPGPARRRYTGVIRGLEGDALHLETPEGPASVPFHTIERANLVLDLEAYQKLATDPPPAVEEPLTDPFGDPHVLDHQ